LPELWKINEGLLIADDEIDSARIHRFFSLFIELFENSFFSLA